jgi:hypothetical protein
VKLYITVAAIRIISSSRSLQFFSRIPNLCRGLDVFLTARGAEAAIEAAHQTSGQRLDPELVEMADSPFTDAVLWRGLDSKDFSNAASEGIKRHGSRVFGQPT